MSTHKKGELLGKAIVLMVNSHEGQYDRGGKPYALHPLEVMHLLNTNDEELQCIALLHDVIEDAGVTYKQLKELGFTDRIIDAVRLLTKVPGQSYEEYQEAVMSNVDSMLVKQADLTHNSDIRRLKGIRQKDEERIVKYQAFYFKISQKLFQMENGDASN